MERQEEARVGEMPSAAVATSERARKENSSNKRDTALPSPRVYRGGPVQATLSAPSMAEGPLSAPRALCDGGGQLSAANIDRDRRANNVALNGLPHLRSYVYVA